MSSCCILALTMVHAINDKDIIEVYNYFGTPNKESLIKTIEYIVITNKGSLQNDYLFTAASSVDHLRYMRDNYLFNPTKYMSFDFVCTGATESKLLEMRDL